MGGKTSTSSRAGRARSTVGGADPARASEILERLQKHWAHATCELDFRDAYELTVATVLSAQSTDRRVNMVTPALFRRYPNAAALAEADPDELEALIHSTGFFRHKARNLIAMARKVVSDFGGDIPTAMEEMTALPGVARKTANVVLGTARGIASGIVVDTHVRRVAGRLGLTAETDPVKIERDLMAVIPRQRWIGFSHQLIWHGRYLCTARNPDCERCPLAPACPEARL